MTKPDSALRKVRRARTLKQEQLAALVGVTQATISKAERGLIHLTRDNQELCATILGVSRAELFPEPEQVSA